MVLRCSACHAASSKDADAWRCTRCGGPWNLDGARDLHRPLTPSSNGVWRYAPWMPERLAALSLGEVTTPLIEVATSERRLWVKNEGCLPTGSFKDRGSAVMLANAVARGHTHVVVDSSGNTAASVAAYAAKAGLACDVYVPASASAGKVMQAEAYGARLRRIDGPRSAARDAARRAVSESDVAYVPHPYNAYFVEGTRTFAYEIFEQTDGELPHAVVLPVGQGTLALGAALGFEALCSAGLTSFVPRIYVVRSASFPSLTDAPAAEHGATGDNAMTIAEGVAIAEPVRGREVLDAVTRTGGAVVAVDDARTWDSLFHLAGQGILVEPTSAVAFAGAELLVAQGSISPTDRVVVASTGTGLKAASTITERMASSPRPRF